MYYDKREKLNLYHTIDHIAALNNEWNEFETGITLCVMVARDLVGMRLIVTQSG
jgi:hypothetical protein